MSIDEVNSQEEELEEIVEGEDDSEELEAYFMKIIKKDPYHRSVPWGERAALIEKYNKEFKENFFKVINKVVESGGVIKYGKRELDSHHYFYNNSLNIRLPPSKYEEIATMTEVEKLDKRS